MKKQGTVVRWDTARGFGFIRSPATAADIFFHARDFRGGGVPADGLAVTFEEIHVGGKGPRAMAVQPARALTHPPALQGGAHPSAVRRGDRAHGPRTSRGRRAPARETPAAPALILMLAWAALIGWGVWVDRLPKLALATVPLLNLVTFYAYWTDKYAAQNGQWRTTENTLHLFGLLGGWPGAWAAHQILRHKSRKAKFRAAYWVTVVLNCAALCGWLFWVQPSIR